MSGAGPVTAKIRKQENYGPDPCKGGPVELSTSQTSWLGMGLVRFFVVDERIKIAQFAPSAPK